MSKVEWPRGAKAAAFVRQAKAHAQTIQTGTLLSIDPASGKTSMPGYSLRKKGELIERGTIEINPRLPAQERLSELYECVRAEFGEGIDLVAIERLRGSMVSPVLHYSAGVIITAIGAPYIEVPIECWKALAKVTDGYEKADDADADMIGRTLVYAATEPNLEPTKRAPRRRRRK